MFDYFMESITSIPALFFLVLSIIFWSIFAAKKINAIKILAIIFSIITLLMYLFAFFGPIVFGAISRAL